MCLAVRHAALYFSAHLEFLGWARCSLLLEKHNVWNFVSDRHKHSKPALSCQEQPSICAKLLTNRKYWLSPCFTRLSFEMHSWEVLFSFLATRCGS